MDVELARASHFDPPVSDFSRKLRPRVPYKGNERRGLRLGTCGMLMRGAYVSKNGRVRVFHETRRLCNILLILVSRTHLPAGLDSRYEMGPKS